VLCLAGVRQVEGITMEILKHALARAKAGRVHILAEMEACSPPPRLRLSPYAPRIARIPVPMAKVRRTVCVPACLPACLSGTCRLLCVLHPPYISFWAGSGCSAQPSTSAIVSLSVCNCADCDGLSFARLQL
jgi:hypothetical protein